MTPATLRSALSIGLVAACLLAYASDSIAQPAVSTLSGRVTDPQDAVVADAVITLRHDATGAAWSATSDGEGRFTLPMLPPGTYGAEVARAGFAPWRAEALVLQVGQSRHLDVRLALGGVADAIVVRGEDRPRTTAVESVVAEAEIQALPLNGRNFLELALLVTGHAPAPIFDPTKTNSALISSAGQIGRGGTITIDGQPNTDDVVGGPLLNLPIDAVQEFQVATGGFGADLGRSAGSAVNVVTRSGTNVVRGSASIFARHRGWQALPDTFDPTEAGTPPFHRQQISAGVGGPVQRDRLFWFAAGEVRRQEGAVLVGTRNVAARTIDRSFASAPLRDGQWLLRLDTAGSAHRLSVRYAGQHATDTAASAIERPLGSATQRQDAANRYHHVLGTWTAVPSARVVNALRVSLSTFLNDTSPVARVPQLTFPSLQDGASFRMPQETRQMRLQVANHLSIVRGAHTVRAGGEIERIDAEFRLGVFQQGRIELVQDFPMFDHTGDGVVDDNDLLFAVTLRSGRPDQPLLIPDADNVHLAGFVQDDWSVSDRLQLALGLRYEFDSDVNNQSRVGDLNPIVLPFVQGDRRRDTNNVAPRVGLAWTPHARIVGRAGYGLHYDRIVLQIQSLERGLDGRALPIEVRAGNVFYLDPDTGQLPPFAPTLANPFTGFILPGAGASGINIIDSRLQHPMVHQFHVGAETRLLDTWVRLDGVHHQGTHFLIGRTLGEVFNPVVGGPDRVVNLESSARTKYTALMASANRSFAGGRGLRAAYTLSKAFTWANDDQIPFLGGPIDPQDLRREFGPAPQDRRHRLVLAGQTPLPGGLVLAGLWTISSGVPMDILMPDGLTRVPALQRNAGGRLFRTPAQLNAFLEGLNAAGGVDGTLLPLVSGDARFTDRFSSVDVRVSLPMRAGTRLSVEPLLEVFNVFNTTNILGTTNVNYSGFTNALVRDAEDPADPGYLRSSRFGRPVTTAGGVFGSGGPRAMQLAARVRF
jgi:hypothetical protein